MLSVSFCHKRRRRFWRDHRMTSQAPRATMHERPNNSMQRTALRAAADAERSTPNSRGYTPVHLLTKVSLISIGVRWLVLVILFVFPNLLPIASGFAILLSLPVAFALLVLSLVALFQR